MLEADDGDEVPLLSEMVEPTDDTGDPDCG
jgi:hypothetical protein